MDIVCFDFDGTLVYSQEPEEGKKIFKLKTGSDWPHIGWWSKPQTLDMDIFPTPINPWVYNKYLLHSSDDNCYNIMVTGRMEKLRKEVEKVLLNYNLSFEEVYLNKGGQDTFTFKTRLFESLIKEMNPEKFIMYDDRQEHLYKFPIWAQSQPCKIEIIDVVNKSTKIIN